MVIWRFIHRFRRRCILVKGSQIPYNDGENVWKDYYQHVYFQR